MANTPYSEDRTVRGNELQPAAVVPSAIQRLPEHDTAASAPADTSFRDSTGRAWHKHPDGTLEPLGAARVAAPRAELSDGDRYEISLVVPPNGDATVHRWGVYTSDGTAPAGLDVAISSLAGAPPAEQENTTYTLHDGDTPPSVSNGTGDVNLGYVAAVNSTGTNFIEGNTPNSVYFFVDYTITP